MGAMDKAFIVPYFLNMHCIPVFLRNKKYKNVYINLLKHDSTMKPLPIIHTQAVFLQLLFISSGPKNGTYQQFTR